MSLPISLRSLSPREAIADTLHRCLLGIDSNDHSLFASSVLQTPDLTFTGADYKLEGWTAFNDFATVLFNRVTMHMTSNIRIEVQDGADVARLQCQAIAYHMKAEDARKKEDTSYTAGNLYDIELVRDVGEDGDGVWKIKTWKIEVLWTTGDVKVLHG